MKILTTILLLVVLGACSSPEDALDLSSNSTLAFINAINKTLSEITSFYNVTSYSVALSTVFQGTSSVTVNITTQGAAALANTSTGAIWSSVITTTGLSAGFSIKCLAGYESMAALQKAFCFVLGLFSALSINNLSSLLFDVVNANPQIAYYLTIGVLVGVFSGVLFIPVGHTGQAITI